MIEHITIRNFKSIGEVAVNLSPVTVLIGRSGVGKSNFLRAIRFLRNFLVQPDTALATEGGWPRIWPFGSPAPLSFAVRFTIPGYASSFTYEVSWNSHPQDTRNLLVNSERLTLGDNVIFARDEKNWSKWPGEGGTAH